MEEFEQNAVNEVEPQESSQQANPVQNVEQTETPQQVNFKRLREKQRQLEQELEMQRKLNEQLLALSSQAKPQAQEIDEFDAIPDDDYIPKGKVKSLVKKEAQKIAQEIARQEAERIIKHQEQAGYLDKLKRQYPDFNEIVNPETIALLEEQDPELADTIAEIKDPYKIGIQSYKYIKALKLAESVPAQRRVKEADKKIEQNSKTVQSPLAFEKRPMAQAFKMSEQEKTALYEEMMQAAGKAGFSY